nr:MAG TPA: hypothetical protein [Caudoviricetes sp.]
MHLCTNRHPSMHLHNPIYSHIHRVLHIGLFMG